MVFYIVFGIFALASLLLAFKKPLWALILVLVLVPFNAFIVTYLRFALNLSETQGLLLTFWKEWIVLWLAVWALTRILKEGKGIVKIFWFDWFIFGLVFLALISILWGSKDIKTIVFGLRYDFEFFLLYFVARIIKLQKGDLIKIIVALLIPAAVVVIFGVLQSTILPWDFLNRFGYTYSLEWLPGLALQSSQIVGSTRDLSRIFSTLSGPNQLGSYLAIIASILLASILYAKKFIYKLGAFIFFLISLLPMYRTYSRSAWLGLIFALLTLIIYIFVASRKVKQSVSVGIGTAMVLVILIAAIIAGTVLFFNQSNSGLFRETLFRSFSTTGHIDAFRGGLDLIKKSPMGSGIGTAGPASQWAVGTSQAVITESTYLQIGVELGVLGMVVFMATLLGMLIRLFKESVLYEETLRKIITLGSALALISIFIVSFFLHTFADSTTVIILFVLIGVSITGKTKNDDLAYLNTKT
jgi:O-antigen ligase